MWKDYHQLLNITTIAIIFLKNSKLIFIFPGSILESKITIYICIYAFSLLPKNVPKGQKAMKDTLTSVSKLSDS